MLINDQLQQEIEKRKQAEESQLRTEKELLDANKRLQELTAHTHKAIENQMKSIAREVHDELGTALTALKFDLSWLKRNHPFADQEAAERIESMGTIIHEATRSLQRLVADLRPLLIDDADLVATMEWHAKEFENRTGIACKLTFATQPTKVRTASATNLYRVFQESLTNIIRHANATEIDISLLSENGRTVLQISDNGRGISDQQISALDSYGIQGIKERVRLEGGEITIWGIPGRGTTIRVMIPDGIEGSA